MISHKEKKYSKKQIDGATYYKRADYSAPRKRQAAPKGMLLILGTVAAIVIGGAALLSVTDSLGMNAAIEVNQ